MYHKSILTGVPFCVTWKSLEISEKEKDMKLLILRMDSFSRIKNVQILGFGMSQISVSRVCVFFCKRKKNGKCEKKQ